MGKDNFFLENMTFYEHFWTLSRDSRLVQGSTWTVFNRLISAQVTVMVKTEFGTRVLIVRWKTSDGNQTEKSNEKCEQIFIENILHRWQHLSLPVVCIVWKLFVWTWTHSLLQWINYLTKYLEIDSSNLTRMKKFDFHKNS